MSGMLRRLRGVLGLGVMGGLAGALFGSLWQLGVTTLGLGAIDFGSLGWAAALWGGFGAFGASGAGLLLTTLGSKKTLEEVSPWRVGAFGAVMGFLAPVAFILLATGGLSEPYLGFVASVSGVLGGTLGAGLVMTAKRAPTEVRDGGRARALGTGNRADR